MSFQSRLPTSISWTKVAAIALSAIPFVALMIYFVNNTINLPWGEGYFFTTNIVLPTYDGQLTPDRLFAQFYDHRTVVSNVLIAANTLLTRWDIRVQSLITIAEMVTVFIFALLSFRADRPQAVVYAAIPFSMLLFSIRLSTTWFRQYNDQVFPLLFTSIGLWLIRTRTPGWRTLLISALVALLSFYSTLTGIAAWLVFPMCMFMVGYRRRAYYAVWGTFFVGCMVPFFMGFAPSNHASFAAPLTDTLLFTWALLGSALTRDMTIGYVVTVLGAAVIVANLWYLKSRPVSLRSSAVWLSMIAFSVITAFMTAYGRSWEGIVRAVRVPHYARLSVYGWAGIIGLVLLVMFDQKKPRRGLWWLNVGACVVLVPLYLQANIESAITWDNGRDGPVGPTTAEEDCAWQYVISGYTACMKYIYWFNAPGANLVYKLAERRLTTFAYDNPAMMAIMPPDYQPDDLIVVDGPLAVQHLPLEDEFHSPVPDSHIYRLMLPTQVLLYYGPPVNLVTGSSGAHFDAARRAIKSARRIWLLRAFTSTPQGDQLADMLGGSDLKAVLIVPGAALYPTVTLYLPPG